MANCRRLLFAILAALPLVACGQPALTTKPPAKTSETEAAATTATVWPSGFNVLGDGYPRSGDPCRRLGESDLTSNYLDDSAILVGCPGPATDDAVAAVVTGLGGRVVDTVRRQAGDVTLISVPTGTSNAGGPATSAPAGKGTRR